MRVQEWGDQNENTSKCKCENENVKWGREDRNIGMDSKHIMSLTVLPSHRERVFLHGSRASEPALVHGAGHSSPRERGRRQEYT